MKVAFFDTHTFEQEIFESKNQSFGHEISFLKSRLDETTASLAAGFDSVCAFANDRLGEQTLKQLKKNGTRLVALRSAGFNHVDLKAAQNLNLTVVRVPEYSPHAIAEHAICLLLALDRKIHRAYSRVRELNFSLDGLVGFDLYRTTVGVVGTGKIGQSFARILNGFGCEILMNDVNPDESFASEIGARYVALPEIYQKSKIISLHVPLTPKTTHLLDEVAFAQMKPGVFIINTGRGGLIDTRALIQALKTKKIGAAGLDVYEEEEKYFFHDFSDKILLDDDLARLLTFPNVLITSHQGFLTEQALNQIAEVTLKNISDFENSRPLVNQVLL